MYEVWVNQENPAVHLVKGIGAPFPEPTGRPMMNWTMMGTSKVSPSVAAAVEQHGAAEVLSVTPFDPNGVFGADSAPAGAQVNIPR